VGDLALLLSQTSAPLQGEAVRQASLASPGPQHASGTIAPRYDSEVRPGQTAPATLALLGPGGTSLTAADGDAVEAAKTLTTPPPPAGAAQPAPFEQLTPAHFLDPETVVADSAWAWGPLRDAILVDSLPRPERGEGAAPDLAFVAEGGGSPLLAGFALLGGAWWVGLSEPEAPRPQGRRPRG
jgi:hypothetical protein